MQLRQIASNMTQLDLADGTSVLFSYRTPVAALTDNGYYRTSRSGPSQHPVTSTNG